MQGCESRRGIWATDLISKMTEATDVPISVRGTKMSPLLPRVCLVCPKLLI